MPVSFVITTVKSEFPPRWGNAPRANPRVRCPPSATNRSTTFQNATILLLSPLCLHLPYVHLLVPLWHDIFLPVFVPRCTRMLRSYCALGESLRDASRRLWKLNNPPPLCHYVPQVCIKRKLLMYLRKYTI